MLLSFTQLNQRWIKIMPNDRFMFRSRTTPSHHIRQDVIDLFQWNLLFCLRFFTIIASNIYMFAKNTPYSPFDDTSQSSNTKSSRHKYSNFLRRTNVDTSGSKQNMALKYWLFLERYSILGWLSTMNVTSECSLLQNCDFWPWRMGQWVGSTNTAQWFQEQDIWKNLCSRNPSTRWGGGPSCLSKCPHVYTQPLGTQSHSEAVITLHLFDVFRV